MSTADRLLAALRALLAEFRSPEHRYWLTSACADRLEAVLTEHEVGSCANQLAGWLKEQGWQPIATAPQDERRILAYDGCEGMGSIYICTRRAEFDWWDSEHDDVGAGMPTHWMPLPAAPRGVGDTRPPRADQDEQQP